MFNAGAAIQTALDEQRRADLRRIDPLIAALREAYELVPWIDLSAFERDLIDLSAFERDLIANKQGASQ